MKMEILGRYPGDPGMRKATEAVSIKQNKPSLNTRNEWINEPRPPVQAKHTKVTSKKAPNVRYVTANCTLQGHLLHKL